MECRDRIGLFPEEVFKLWTCSMCYSYLFPDAVPLTPNGSKNFPKLDTWNGSASYTPNIENSTSKDLICATLSNDDCRRWSSCCIAALMCCQRQISITFYDPPGHYCPPTWDGFSCFEATRAGTKAIISCPSYIDQAVPTAIASKHCTLNGTWWRENVTNQEWTDYTTCVHLQGFKTLYYVGVSCNILSLALLLPACVVFVLYRAQE
ncbi:calcitonin receptor-like [Haliotis rufescens]|uniref:calcitonin receptor-like n=1 Tax=Haliotis rufescens TaxID=6454 RepID=UPI00201EAF9C|nr:calcitonin receptor-like [Haliotis rufescens]